jgi:hypothetical protein
MACINPKSIIDEPWDPDYEPSLYIELLDFYDTVYDDKKFCFRRDELRSIMNTDIYQTAKWYIDPGYERMGYVFNDDGWVINPRHPEEKYALGYPSIIERYIRVPIDEGLEFYVLQQNLEAILFTDTVDFIGIVIDETRVGNSYTMSGSHGQLPSVQIYYLVPRKMYEEAPEAVNKEIYNMIFTMKLTDIQTPTLRDAKYLQINIADLDRMTENEISSPIQSPIRDSIASPRRSFEEELQNGNEMITPLRSSLRSPLSSPMLLSIRSPRRSLEESENGAGMRTPLRSPILSPILSPIQSPRSLENRADMRTPIRSPRRLQAPALRPRRWSSRLRNSFEDESDFEN